MNPFQSGILAPLPPLARHLFFSIAEPQGLPAALDALLPLVDGDRSVAGLGESLVHALDGRVAALRTFPALSGAGVDVPSTQHALWCWLRGSDRGELLHRARALQAAVAPALRLELATDTFVYDTGRDLTGYEDGTENPQGEDAVAAAFVTGAAAGEDGSSFVAVQHWTHDLDRFAALPPAAQDHVMGRRKSDNEELDDAPPSAHVKRTAQESFDPEAFVLRRSMPWAEGGAAGLLFVAFGRSLDAYEVQMRRMAGLDDGIADALFGFSKPTTGGYYWCPPLREGRLDLRLIGR
ncbi:Dyp-type peroxidase [Azoarcus olearius]|uniref:Iron-dependent peroxidase n=1 Tax=Azoarcus sp. (strain BH72) TaxID=418699 RepID=A1K8L0_AZOSB|nr:Dyp-type peroxidase [Azoarcus olearius]ANQ85736.1 putative iron-dependent peroxidase [Azoarcus olearius]CAL95165.1 putative iron-dependent peroxidase [Azoarcus olearius]